MRSNNLYKILKSHLSLTVHQSAVLSIELKKWAEENIRVVSIDRSIVPCFSEHEEMQNQEQVTKLLKSLECFISEEDFKNEFFGLIKRKHIVIMTGQF